MMSKVQRPKSNVQSRNATQAVQSTTFRLLSWDGLKLKLVL